MAGTAPASTQERNDRDWLAQYARASHKPAYKAVLAVACFVFAARQCARGGKRAPGRPVQYDRWHAVKDVLVDAHCGRHVMYNVLSIATSMLHRYKSKSATSQDYFGEWYHGIDISSPCARFSEVVHQIYMRLQAAYARDRSKRTSRQGTRGYVSITILIRKLGAQGCKYHHGRPTVATGGADGETAMDAPMRTCAPSVPAQPPRPEGATARAPTVAYVHDSVALYYQLLHADPILVEHAPSSHGDEEEEEEEEKEEKLPDCHD